VYSLRARERPTVSTPVTWEEVERTLQKKDANLLVFEAKQTVARVEKMGDLFAPLLELKQRLPDLKALAAAQPEAPVSIAAQAEEEEKPKKTPRRAVKKTGRPQARQAERKV
jgi:bifunctional non-homologous end joining protein LigD